MQERADRRRGIIVVYYFIFDERGNGVEDGSEKVSGFMMPVLVVVIAIYSLTLKTREQTSCISILESIAANCWTAWTTSATPA